MKFQHRVLMTYSAFISFLVLLMFGGFVVATNRIIEENLRSSYQSVIEKALQQFDNHVRSMDFLETNLISGKIFKQSLGLLSSLDRAKPSNFADINEARQAVQDALYSYAILKNFYSVNVFNRRGDYFSSSYLHHSQVSDAVPFLPQIQWIPEAEDLWGRRLLIPPRDDIWSLNSPKKVFSLVRAMPGGEGLLGYMEVQSEVEELQKFFQVPDRSGVRVVVWTDQGKLMYSSRPISGADSSSHWKRSRTEPDQSSVFLKDPATGVVDAVLKVHSQETGVTVGLILEQSVALAPVWSTATLVAWIGLAILIVSIIFSWWSSRQLTRPLRVIQHRMNTTGITDLTRAHDLTHPNDEIIALHDAFEEMKRRLDDAIREEIRSRTLGVQAQLESLQAQVNPHFIYNILTVLAAKGLEAGSREVGEICGGIAQMLRYSTDMRMKTATLTEELDHTRTYLNLMQKRFEDRLLFSFEVSPGTENVQIPKIIVQQLVENSLNHGFETVSRAMVIQVRATVTDEWWELEVLDNGQGFTEMALETQNKAISETRERLANQSWGEGLAIGGLGLRNTFGRLHLFFQGRIQWSMGNREPDGAFVRIHCTRTPHERSYD